MQHIIHELNALIPAHGASVLFVVALISCAGIPMPTSAMMMAAGAFIAAGDMHMVPVMIATLVGAVIGDQIGFFAGRFGGEPFWQRFHRNLRLAPTMDRAQKELDRRALIAVIISRFPLSALGPWINLASGATRVGWSRFSLGVLIGDGIWILAYIGGGYVFADNVSHLSAKMTSVLSAVAFLGLAMMVGRAMWRKHEDG
ncbi:DedA family protein [Tabrizicola sp. J26]|uniref:DedA family protein n=1 Tax=Alitabrizicola rongguiensis TaxID=2909234 RepID=UPI001F20B147|nr:DedA family protein [Tabrizicola rongguiensis]MCF1710081.1 DedA family protein [Tabrizicola rongguiensis]